METMKGLGMRTFVDVTNYIREFEQTYRKELEWGFKKYENYDIEAGLPKRTYMDYVFITIMDVCVYRNPLPTPPSES